MKLFQAIALGAILSLSSPLQAVLEGQHLYFSNGIIACRNNMGKITYHMSDKNTTKLPDFFQKIPLNLVEKEVGRKDNFVWHKGVGVVWFYNEGSKKFEEYHPLKTLGFDDYGRNGDGQKIVLDVNPKGLYAILQTTGSKVRLIRGELGRDPIKVSFPKGLKKPVGIDVSNYERPVVFEENGNKIKTFHVSFEKIGPDKLVETGFPLVPKEDFFFGGGGLFKKGKHGITYYKTNQMDEKNRPVKGKVQTGTRLDPFSVEKFLCLGNMIVACGKGDIRFFPKSFFPKNAKNDSPSEKEKMTGSFNGFFEPSSFSKDKNGSQLLPFLTPGGTKPKVQKVFPGGENEVLIECSFEALDGLPRKGLLSIKEGGEKDFEYHTEMICFSQPSIPVIRFGQEIRVAGPEGKNKLLVNRYELLPQRPVAEEGFVSPGLGDKTFSKPWKRNGIDVVEKKDSMKEPETVGILLGGLLQKPENYLDRITGPIIDLMGPKEPNKILELIECPQRKSYFFNLLKGSNPLEGAPFKYGVLIVEPGVERDVMDLLKPKAPGLPGVKSVVFVDPDWHRIPKSLWEDKEKDNSGGPRWHFVNTKSSNLVKSELVKGSSYHTVPKVDGFYKKIVEIGEKN